eukprot:3497_1
MGNTDTTKHVTVPAGQFDRSSHLIVSVTVANDVKNLEIVPTAVDGTLNGLSVQRYAEVKTKCGAADHLHVNFPSNVGRFNIGKQKTYFYHLWNKGT